MLYYKLSKVSNLKTAIAVLLCVLSHNLLLSQDTEPSPWSRFGLGLNVPTLSTPQLLMGGVSAPMMEGGVINPEQPASAAGCTSTIFQSSVHGSRNTMNEGDSSTTSLTGSIGAMNIVVKRPGGKTSIMMGMLPYSANGYNLSRSSEDELLGHITERYRGSGGTAKSYLGLAHAFRSKKWIDAGEADSVLVLKNSVYLGAQVNYLFGEVIQQSRLDIEDITFLDNRTSTSMRHRSLGGVFGLQAFQLLYANYDADKNFKNSASLFIGGTYATSSTLYTDYEKIVESVQLLSSVETPVDTAFYLNTLDAEGKIPSKWTAGAGISFEGSKGRRILIVADMMQEDWASVANDFDIDLIDGNAEWAKASRKSLGLSIKPASSGSNSSIFSRSTYRAGFAIDEYPIKYLDNQLTGWRASAGLSIPLEGSRSNSNLHFGVEYGHRSLSDANGIVLDNTLEESIFNIQVGVSLAPFFKNLWLTPKLYD
ncbi:MAG: hypothetical protein CL823_04195 [Crocinitomicaceae bacterium]|nr:hypothetical protein [Crocinitomicaceae bacterium]